MDDVQCTGYESSLSSCGHIGWGRHNCGHYEDAGVRCRVRRGENKFNIKHGIGEYTAAMTMH